MAQRKDHEQELLTCGINTPLLFWDCDVLENVEMINITERINCIQISPTGRFFAMGNDLGEIIIFQTDNKNFMGKY